MSTEELAECLDKPIGTQKLETLAKGKERAVIVFDEMTRPTRTYELAPLVVERILRVGFKKDQITFVCALGTHGAGTKAAVIPNATMQYFGK